jgi:hypothetical protein
MALIEARKRMDVTGVDISEQPGSDWILLYNDLPFAVDRYTVDDGILIAYLGTEPVVIFNARRATWVMIRRDRTKLASKEDIASAQADLQKLQEEMFAKFHPDEYRAYQKQRAQSLGLGTQERDPGNYL